ncbi:MAG: stalk domain-containing protein [Clostridia bacterium]|nr:stalk domain-containing protein [Clostridia bacterium]
MRKFLFLCAMLFILSFDISAYAQELPKSFWGLDNGYAQALKTGDNYGIIYYASKEEELLQNEPQTEQINNIIASRLDQMGLAYEKLGDYVNAGLTYERYIPYAQANGWDDGVKIAKAKVLQYTPNIDVYLSQEKKADRLLFGANFDGEIRKRLSNESMILVYLEFGNSDFTWVEKTLNEAQSTGKAVEIALNLPGEGSQIGNVLYSQDYIVSLLEKIEQYNGVTVFLRFGAEMNVWTNPASPSDFIEAFRLVSNLSHQYAPNAKMVWSVNQVSNWNVNMNDYYPGDEYVDYVGVSAYVQKYFLGRNDWDESQRFNELVFFTGDGADSVKALSEVISLYGHRKPVIIAEGGVSHYIRSLNEDASDWALLNLKRMYSYLPMVYPQIKLMAYFDRTMANETSEYSLSTNEKMAQEYLSLTNTGRFAGNIAYAKLDDTLTIQRKPQQIYSYVHIYKHPYVSATYYVDDVWAGTSADVPYGQTIDFSGYELGQHTLKVVISDSSGILQEKTYYFNLVEKSIDVVVNNNKVLFDVDPIIANGRALVPMRAIFEALGASVEWNEATKTITANSVKGIITMQIGNKAMTKGNEKISLDVEPTIYDGRTLVPARAVSEALGATVEWDGSARLIRISN